jgi:hypothetical protein
MTEERITKLDDVMYEVFGKRFTEEDKVELRQDESEVAYNAIMAMAEEY